MTQWTICDVMSCGLTWLSWHTGLPSPGSALDVVSAALLMSPIMPCRKLLIEASFFLMENWLSVGTKEILGLLWQDK